MDYKKSGVNIDEGNRFVSLIKQAVDSTKIQGVSGGIGSFAGFFSLAAFKDMKEPVLVSGTDGVGTKLKIAVMAEKYDTVGIDLVAMSVNDLAVTGAEPLFFLDYIATGKLVPEKMYKVVEGIAEGCRQAGCAILGGETAEMPGMYSGEDFDLAGFAVGIADKPKIIDGSRVKKGDKIIGISSSGFHSNGYSLLRKILFDKMKLSPSSIFAEDMTLADSLLIPTKIYVKSVKGVKNAGIDIKAMAHITGGGFYDNIPRVLPKNISANIDISSVKLPPVIEKFKSVADIEPRELYRVLNMGVGFIFIVSPQDEEKTLETLLKAGEKAWPIGETVEGSYGVKIKGIDN